jgi:hypothetical protein
MLLYLFDKVGEKTGFPMADFMDFSQLREMIGDTPMGMDQAQFAKAPLFFKQTLLFPYLDGLVFCDKLKKRGGWAMVNKAFNNPPISTEQIFHPEKYINFEPPIDIGFKTLGKKIGDYSLLDQNVLGEMVIRILFQQFLPGSDYKGIAAGWGGDRYRIYNKGKDSILVWYTTWDTVKDATEFFNNYKRLLKVKHKNLIWTKSMPGKAYLGAEGSLLSYIGISNKDVIVVEYCPEKLMNGILSNIWNVSKVNGK